MIARTLIFAAVVLAATANDIQIEGCDSSKCPAVNGEHPIYFPHSSDCTKFCQCEWGVAFEMECLFGLHFNPILNACDFPASAGCDLTIRSSDPETTTQEETTPTSAPIENCDSSNCPAVNGEFPVLFAHNSDCGKFCKCNDGVAYEMECPDGFHFNPSLNVCDWPESAGCDETITSPDPETSTQEEITPTSTPIGKCDSSKCPAVNPELPIHFPHPDDCSKFCKCDKGVAYDMDCQDGLHFNPDIDACDWPEFAGCDVTGQ